MAQRNMTDLFFMLRNNLLYSRNVYSDTNNSDNIALLDRGLDELASCSEQPSWMKYYEDATYLFNKIRIKTEDLVEIHGCTSRLVLSENVDGKERAKLHARDVSRMISSVHSNIKALKSFARSKNRIETILLQNVEKKMLMTLKSTTEQFQQSQAAFTEKQNSVEQNSNLFFENISSHSQVPGCNAVETFDNFLNINVSTSSSILHFNEAGNLDEYFELPAAGLNINQKQLMLIEAGNTKMIKNREQEVSKIVNSIDDLNVVFKDMSQIVQEQGTILDRIDYNIESTQTKIFEGYKQLQKADKYQRKNKRIYCILILASLIIFIFFLTISTKL